MPNREPKEGKKFGGNFRNYSHLWEDGHGYSNASKGEKPRIRDFLAREHEGMWFAALADSGQKHVIPWAPMNGPGRGGVVLFDEERIVVPASLELVDKMKALLTMGATKEELGSGDYSARAWQLCGASLRTFDDAHGAHRGGAWFGLALWLAQRDEETVQRRLAEEKEKKNARRGGKGKAADPHGGGTSRNSRRIPRDTASKHAETLGPTPDADAECVADVRDSGGVGNVDGAPAPDRDTPSRQRTLFD